MKPRGRVLPGADPGLVQKEQAAQFDRLGEMAEGVPLGKVTVGTSVTRIPHGLGTIPNQALITPMADARVWEAQDPDATYLYLQASVSVVCKVSVF